ncbi:aldo/keto reductase [Pseudomonas eucalypticola]|uniref:Aldo/keto reductase n=1 Tax=Pseudomonas eucalypticola TaxID=2599595 RepID=A0A7D5D7U6_9PSED|nr:aldo/keto reductase [Pseudomonas eucalypticola]QKZ04997.1 aldo/keto reductase [Pseudomonas eucalypticola]
MQQRQLGTTDLRIAPLVFGGNVLGWTADEATSLAVLDAFVDQGFNAIDTADVYSAWVPGHVGGESETLLGKWFKARPGRREKVALFTKVGMKLGEDKEGLKEKWIVRAVEDSLRRLGTDYIDLYFSHRPDATTPEEETLGAYAKLLQAGKIRSIGASNFDAAQLAASLETARNHQLPSYQVLQPEYNLYDRDQYEGALRDLCIAENIGVVTYYSLASGFLTGKYRTKADLGKSVRGGRIEKYLDERGLKLLATLDGIAEAHQAAPGEVALAWLIAREGVTAPIASATSLEQVHSFGRAARLVLSREELDALTAA